MQLTLLTPSRIACRALLVATMAVAAGCASSGAVEDEQVYQAPNGFAVVDTVTLVGTVTAVDTTKRKVTLTTPDGKSSTCKADKGVDLSSFQLGERIGFQATEAMLLVVRKDSRPPADAAVIDLAAASEGRASGIFQGEAVEESAKIVALDVPHRKATLQFADGSTRTYKAHKGMNLDNVAVGDVVTAEYAESLVIATVKE